VKSGDVLTITAISDEALDLALLLVLFDFSPPSLSSKSNG